MLNNRQGGRRRGRGGQRPQGGGRGPESGNRIDNRARGNAAQLLEKYKTLARDAQLSGDRVTTEYYLQFADHYFRVLSESRARFEENQNQRRQRDDFSGDDEFEGEGDRAEAESEARREGGDQPRRERFNGQRDERREREPAPEQAAGDEGAGEEREPRRGRRRRERANGTEEEAQGFDPSLLPPSVSANEASGENAPVDIEAAPRRRTRRPRAEAQEATPDAA